MITYEWRGKFENAAVNVLHAEGFDHRFQDIDWHAQINRHSLGWVRARQAHTLVGFVNGPGTAGCTPSSSTPWSPSGRDTAASEPG